MSAAVGAQLEILAKYVGTKRAVYGLDLTHPYFARPFAADADPGSYPGFAFAADAVVSDYFLMSGDFDQPVYAMTDDELLRLILFLAQTHHNFLSLAEIDAILFQFFGNNVTLTDNGDMTITYHHDPADTDTLFSIVQGTNSLPRPAGVALIFT